MVTSVPVQKESRRRAGTRQAAKGGNIGSAPTSQSTTIGFEYQVASVACPFCDGIGLRPASIPHGQCEPCECKRGFIGVNRIALAYRRAVENVASSTDKAILAASGYDVAYLTSFLGRSTASGRVRIDDRPSEVVRLLAKEAWRRTEEDYRVLARYGYKFNTARGRRAVGLAPVVMSASASDIKAAE